MSSLNIIAARGFLGGDFMGPQVQMIHRTRRDETRRCFLGRGLFGAGWLLSSTLGAAAPATGSGPVAQTQTGKVRGRTQGGALVFKGIPYGSSTEGAGRFMPPQKPPPWTGIREALAFGPASPQVLANLIP